MRLREELDRIGEGEADLRAFVPLPGAPILALRETRPEVVFVPASRDQMALVGPQLDFYRENLPPHAEIDTPPTFGHAPFLHQADAVARRLLRFVRQVG